MTSIALLIACLGVFLAEDFMLFLLKGIFGVTHFWGTSSTMVDCGSGLSSWSWTGDGVPIREIENRPCTLGVSVKDMSPTASIAEVEALLADPGVLGVAGVEDGVGPLFEADGDILGLGDGVLALVLGDLLAGD